MYGIVCHFNFPPENEYRIWSAAHSTPYFQQSAREHLIDVPISVNLEDGRTQDPVARDTRAYGYIFYLRQNILRYLSYSPNPFKIFITLPKNV